MDIKKKVTIGIAALAIGTAGTAVAAGDDSPWLGGDAKDALAADLASKLDGVNQGNVERALDEVAEERRSEMTAAQSEAIAAELDGVDADAVADALDKAHEQMRAAFEAGERPDRDSLAATLAAELDIDEDAVAKALESAREAQFAERKTEMLDRLDQAVEDGEIDADRAEEIREHIESDEPPKMGKGPGAHGPGSGGPNGPGFGGPSNLG